MLHTYFEFFLDDSSNKMQKDQESHEDNSSCASTDVELENDYPDSINLGYSAGHISDDYDFDWCFDDLLSNSLTQEPNLSNQSEIEKFCCLSLEPRDSDPPSWRRNNHKLFPAHGNIANKMLCSPPFQLKVNASSALEETFTPHTVTD